ncbi:hypothetical protein BD560DRAFT_366351 [Blakeslea trispora]|nr:hypothetical protein BD560DRAFT_366351 [Blakeslea trispora]
MILFDPLAGHATRITPLSSINLPEEDNDVSNWLLTILKVVSQVTLVIEKSNKLV